MDNYRFMTPSSRYGLPVFLLAFHLLVFPARAYTDTLIEQLELSSQMYQTDPYRSHEFLLSIRDKVETAPASVQSIFYLRKAQTELMMYQFPEFAESIRKGISIHDPEIPRDITLWYGIYQCLVLQDSGKVNLMGGCYEDAVTLAREQDNIPAQSQMHLE